MRSRDAIPVQRVDKKVMRDEASVVLFILASLSKFISRVSLLSSNQVDMSGEFTGYTD